jgi:hypothetical protein
VIPSESARAPLWLRLAALLLGIALLLWLPLEDVSVNWVLFFAGAINLWWAVRFLAARSSTNSNRLIVHYLWVGTIAGLAVPPLAVLLMVFKSGVHGHGFSDFFPDQLQAVLLRTPAWGGAGFFLSLGSALWRLAVTFHP